MSRHLVTVGLDTGLAEVAELFRHHRWLCCKVFKGLMPGSDWAHVEKWWQTDAKEATRKGRYYGFFQQNQPKVLSVAVQAGVCKRFSVAFDSYGAAA